MMILAMAVMLQADAHELQNNRLTVILHEQHSVELVFRLDFAGLLQHAMAPQSSPQEFLVAVAAQPPEKIAPALAALQQQVEKGLMLKSRGAVLAVQHWRWPSAVMVQAVLREQLMANMVATAESSSASALEVHADASDVLSIERVTLSLPEVIKPAVVVWYKTRQGVITTQSAEQTLEF